MEKRPLVSILIPCYNASKTINNTVDSVINQTYYNIEILINDDASIDGTYELLVQLYSKHELITITKNSNNLGTAGNWNVLFNKAKGDYWLKLDGDDLLEPSFIEETVTLAQKHQCDFIGTSFKSLDLKTQQKKTPYIHQFMSDGILKNALYDIFITHPFHLCFTLLRADFVKKLAIDQVYFIDTEVCDAEFQVRAALEADFKAYFLNKPLAYYCFHGLNSSTVPLKQARSFIYDLVGTHHKILNLRLGLDYRIKIGKNAISYLKLMLKREAPIDLKLLIICLKRICL